MTDSQERNWSNEQIQPEVTVLRSGDRLPLTLPLKDAEAMREEYGLDGYDLMAIVGIPGVVGEGEDQFRMAVLRVAATEQAPRQIAYANAADTADVPKKAQNARMGDVVVLSEDDLSALIGMGQTQRQPQTKADIDRERNQREQIAKRVRIAPARLALLGQRVPIPLGSGTGLPYWGIMHKASLSSDRNFDLRRIARRNTDVWNVNGNYVLIHDTLTSINGTCVTHALQPRQGSSNSQWV